MSKNIIFRPKPTTQEKRGDPCKLRGSRFLVGDLCDIDEKTNAFHVRISDPFKVRSSRFPGKNFV